MKYLITIIISLFMLPSCSNTQTIYPFEIRGYTGFNCYLGEMGNDKVTHLFLWKDKHGVGLSYAEPGKPLIFLYDEDFYNQNGVEIVTNVETNVQCHKIGFNKCSVKTLNKANLIFQKAIHRCEVYLKKYNRGYDDPLFDY